MKAWLPILSFALVLVPAHAARAQEAPVDSLALARQYTAWLYAGQADSLVAHGSEATEPADYGRLIGMLAERAGNEMEVLEETWKPRNGACQYWRTVRVSKMDEPLLLRWVMDPVGRITGIGLGPLSQAPPVDGEICAPGSGAPSPPGR
ncbi:MAG TPA: hypothetical protein VM778_01675 [Gemmatimonadota bacterium]|nr:hypothetical protein [Gemmatimonadota bacterium]